MPPLWAIRLGVVLAIVGAGWAGHAFKARRDGLAEQVAQVEANREAERLVARNMTRISDALTRDRLRSSRAAADAADRLRQLAEAGPAPAAGCPGRNDDSRPAAWVLRDVDRDDLVALAREAEAVADRLRACQSVIAGQKKAPDMPGL